MSEMNCHVCRGQLHAYLDNEMEAGEALRLHHHLSFCEGCQNSYRHMQALKQLVHDQAPRFTAPTSLRRKIKDQIREEIKGGVIASLLDRWTKTILLPAASLAALALALFLSSNPPGGDLLADEAVSDHVRSLMAQHLTDVPSSDRHTVKPWFIGRLDFAPPVFDFAEQGYTLIGGRMDYLLSETAAALVYQHKKHILNLFIILTPDDGTDAPHSFIKHGYNLMIWQRDHMRFIAVSDMDMEGLKAFTALYESSLNPSTSPKP